MRSRHKVDAVHAPVPQAQQHVPKLRHRDDLAALTARDVDILAENAPQIAAGEEHGSGAVRPGDARLLPVMRGSPRDAWQQGRAADPARFFVTAHSPTAARTERTAYFHDFVILLSV